MQRTYSPEALARREARKAETKARNEAKKAAALAAKQAAIQAQRQVYLDAQQKRRDDFKASLSEQDLVDLQEALSEPCTREDNGFTVVTNDWLYSVKQQFDSKGWLSPAQLAPLLKRVRDRREQAAKSEAWPEIKEGDNVKLACKVISISREQDSYGVSYKIRMLTHYGRKVSIKTGREEWAQHAAQKKEAGKKVYVYAKVKWIAPDAGGPFVLTSRGAKFGDLL